MVVVRGITGADRCGRSPEGGGSRDLRRAVGDRNLLVKELL